jgi:anti-sigma factor (TIGR02949 family)
MKCADFEFIEEYLRGEIAPQEQREFKEHLASCPACRQALERENRLDDLLRRQPLIPAPKGLSARVMSSLKSQRAPYSISDRLWAIGLGMVLAAVGGVLG